MSYPRKDGSSIVKTSTDGARAAVPFMPKPIEYINEGNHYEIVHLRHHPTPDDLQEHRERTLTSTVHHNDLDATNGWLLSVDRKRTESTYRAYRKEACRFFNWATVYGKRPFHRLRYKDIDEYILFLSNPTPTDMWVASKTGAPVARGKAGWRAFRRPEGWSPGNGPLLSKGSIDASLRALKVMFAYFVETNYLWSNPVKEASINVSQADLAAAKEKRSASELQIEDKSNKRPALDGPPLVGNVIDEFEAGGSTSGNRRSSEGKHSGESYMPTECMEQLIDAALERVDIESRKVEEFNIKSGSHLQLMIAVNQACILALMYYQCLRGQEACLLKESDIHPAEDGLVISVLGKGGKPRNSPVRSELIDMWAMIRERAHPVCRPADVFNSLSNKDIALIQNRRKTDDNPSMSYGYDGLNRLWVKFTSDVKPYIDKRWHNTVSHATTHWLRHSGATRLLSEGVSLESVSHLLGHASVMTTMTYIHDRDQKLRRELSSTGNGAIGRNT